MSDEEGASPQLEVRFGHKLPPLVRRLRLRQSLRRRCLRCGSPSIEPSGGANDANVGARRANERGRTPPEMSYSAGKARKEDAGSRNN
jgi:hypothetical protein